MPHLHEFFMCGSAVSSTEFYTSHVETSVSTIVVGNSGTTSIVSSFDVMMNIMLSRWVALPSHSLFCKRHFLQNIPRYTGNTLPRHSDGGIPNILDNLQSSTCLIWIFLQTLCTFIKFQMLRKDKRGLAYQKMVSLQQIQLRYFLCKSTMTKALPQKG